MASFTPIGKLEEMVNIGTLTAFALVSLGRADPAQEAAGPGASFKVPFNPVLPILAALVCVYLALNLSIETWLRFVVWMVLGLRDLLPLRLRAQPGRQGRGRAGRGLLDARPPTTERGSEACGQQRPAQRCTH